ncbi:12352_t:CDS:2 [Gigaspora rosea]|nr:12352_t:CDS:2 [Gigaspora rosea]
MNKISKTYHDAVLEDIKPTKEYGKCPRCEHENDYEDWCRSCAVDIYISELPKDIFDYLTQPKNERENIFSQAFYQILELSKKYSRGITSFFEYIPIERFQDIEYLTRGGFGVIYKAKWLDGEIENINFIKNTIKRKGSHFVALKVVEGNMSESVLFAANIFDFGAKVHGYTSLGTSVAIVMRFYEENARSLIARDYLKLSWIKRCCLMMGVSKELSIMHSHETIHGDLHTGNLLYDGGYTLTISDFGHFKFPNKEFTKEEDRNYFTESEIKFKSMDFFIDDCLRLLNPPPEKMAQCPDEFITSKKFNYSTFIKENLNSSSQNLLLYSESKCLTKYSEELIIIKDI